MDESGFGQAFDDYVDSLNGFMNANGRTGLVSPQQVAALTNAAGKVVTDGNGGYVIVVDLSLVPSTWTNTPEGAAAIYNAIRDHEQNHADRALNDDPNIFNTSYAGWGLGYDPAERNDREATAHQAQLDSLNNALVNGNLTGEARSDVEAFRDSVQEQIDTQNWGG